LPCADIIARSVFVEHTMKYRKLRIAWSVGWGVACVLLIVLWIHSYWYQDQIVVWMSNSMDVHSLSWHGWMGVGYSWFDTKLEDMSRHGNTRVHFHYMGPHVDPPYPPAGWARSAHNTPAQFYCGLILPFWFPVLLSAAIAAVPWIRCRFTLRTLLIATTLVAVVLGAIVWAVR
jgi:hypothetical protein